MALVVFLRGVNVGGHRTFRPSLVANELKDLDIVNVGAAGTFVVRKQVSRAKLRTEIIRQLPFKAEVVICKGDDVLDLASGNPFAGQAPGAIRNGFLRRCRASFQLRSATAGSP